MIGIILILVGCGMFSFYIFFMRCECGACWHTKEERKFFLIYTAIGLFLVLIGLLFIKYDLESGNYIVQNQWIASEYGNKTVCEECLMIEFYEGCNRYKTFIFANEHELNPSLKIGTPVNINFIEVEGERYIKGVIKAKRYRNKC